MNGILLAILALAGHAWLYGIWVLAYVTPYPLFLRIPFARRARLHRAQRRHLREHAHDARWPARARDGRANPRQLPPGAPRATGGAVLPAAGAPSHAARTGCAGAADVPRGAAASSRRDLRACPSQRAARQAHSARRSAASSRSSPISTSSVSARRVAPRLAKLERGANACALDEAAARFAREVHEALRADEAVAERFDHGHHALADERRIVGERDRDELAAVVMAAWSWRRRAWSPCDSSSTRAACASRRPSRSSRARPHRRSGKLARSACGASSSSTAWVATHRVGRRDVELREQHAIGGGDLLAGFVARRRRRSRRTRHRPRRPRPPATMRVAHAPRRNAHEAVEDRRGLGDAGGLEHDVIGRATARRCRRCRPTGRS